MDNLIRVIADATAVVIAGLSVIGLVALLSAIGFILYLEFKGSNDTEPPKEEKQ